MLQDMIQTPEQLSILDCISSPLSDEILDFKYDEDFFKETIGALKITSPTTAANITSPETDDDITLSCYDNAFPSAFSNFDSSDILSDLLDNQPPPDPEPDILPPNSPLSMLPMNPPYPLSPISQLDQMIAAVNGFTSYSSDSMMSQLPLTMSGYLGLEQPSLRPYSFLDSRDFYTDGIGAQACGGDGEMGFFARGRRLMGPQEVTTGPADACGMSIYAPGSMHMVYSSGDLQVLGDGQHLVGRCGINSTSLPRASDVSALEDSSYKVGRLSVEERKEKIHRYLEFEEGLRRMTSSVK